MKKENTILKQVQNDKMNESGRSMVEMLGVLAVMGVLSVGGVAMYTSAMNKHRANEILNEASKRAVVVAGQLLNRDKGNLSEFTNNDVAGATFATGEVSPNNGQFEIKFADGKKPDATICAQMKAAAGDNSAMTIAEDCSSITFYNDLSKGGTPSGDSIDTGTCANGNVYLSYAEAGHECDTTTPQNMGCTKNSDCTGEKCSAESGKCYCKLTGNWQNDCAEITGGTCEMLDDGWETTYIDPTDATKTKTFLVVSSDSDIMTWWAAENFCLAHGMKLASLGSLGLSTSYSYEDELGEGPGPLYTALNAAGVRDGSFWTSNSSSSCEAFSVYVGSAVEEVGVSARNDLSNTVLCE